MDVTARFLAKVLKTESGCWEWQSTIHKSGYGRFWFIDGQIMAHRMAFELFKGDVGKNNVLHTCDNRKCVNPNHLYLGDAKQNAADRTNRLRYKVVTPFVVVQEIRQLYASGNYSQQQLADRFGVKQEQVSRYIHGKQRLIY